MINVVTFRPTIIEERRSLGSMILTSTMQLR
jgi:hypothetical protein